MLQTSESAWSAGSAELWVFGKRVRTIILLIVRYQWQTSTNHLVCFVSYMTKKLISSCATPVFFKSLVTQRQSKILRGSRSRPCVLALMDVGCGVCGSLEEWGNTISMANFLFSSTGVLKHSRLSSRPGELMRSPEATAG